VKGELREMERSHRAGPDDGWRETWGFTFAQDLDRTNPGDHDGPTWLGGFVECTLAPRQRHSWFTTGIVIDGHAYVLCRDHDLGLPSDPNLFEVRGGGLWMHAICETPGEHWTVAMEAFALAFDDPADAWGDERGTRVGLAFDLEWEGRPRDITSIADGYEMPCEIHGVVQLGDDEWEIDATGARYHQWGDAPSGEWRSDPSGAAGDRTTLAVAPYLSENDDGSPRKLRRTLDRVGTNLQWTWVASEPL
jgi:hypothetical protein